VYIEGAEGDPALTFTPFDRTEEENVELGIADMRVEGYEEDTPSVS
jgi:hypothetical protein